MRAITRVTIVTILTAMAATLIGCAPTPPTAVTVIEDKVYPVTPNSITMTAGIVTGEVAEMKVTERVEQGSGRIDSAAKLTGTLKLKNSSADQTVRLIGWNIRYIDDMGQPIKLDENRTEPSYKFSTYGATERLDPGQDTTQSVSVDFPAAALKSKKLKEILLDLTYLPSPFKQETAVIAVSIGAGG